MKKEANIFAKKNWSHEIKVKKFSFLDLNSIFK